MSSIEMKWFPIEDDGKTPPPDGSSLVKIGDVTTLCVLKFRMVHVSPNRKFAGAWQDVGIDNSSD
jgi:hypothetical protein